MNGASAKRTDGRTVGVAAVLAALLAAGVAGCKPDTTYTGQLAPGFSRLTVANQTPWRCEVTVQRADVRCGLAPAGLRAEIRPGEDFRWDLGQGSYELKATKLDLPVESFTKCWQAQSGKELVWPLIDVGSAKPRSD